MQTPSGRLYLPGVFEDGNAQGLSFNAFTQWSKKLPALLTSLRSLPAAGSVDGGSAVTSSTAQVCVSQYC